MFTPPGNWWKKLPFQSPVRPGCWGNPCVESTAAHRGNVTHLNQCNKEHSLCVGLQMDMDSHLCTCSALSPSPQASCPRIRFPQWGAKRLFSPHQSQSCTTTTKLSFSSQDLFLKATLISGVILSRVFLKHVDLLWCELHIFNLPVGLFVFVEIRFDDHCSTAVCLYGHQQALVLLLAQPKKIAHMHTHKRSGLNPS